MFHYLVEFFKVFLTFVFVLLINNHFNLISLPNILLLISVFIGVRFASLAKNKMNIPFLLVDVLGALAGYFALKNISNIDFTTLAPK